MRMEIINRETGEATPLLKVSAPRWVIDVDRAIGSFDVHMARIDWDVVRSCYLTYVDADTLSQLTTGLLKQVKVTWDALQRWQASTLLPARRGGGRAHRKKLKRSRRR